MRAQDGAGWAKTKDRSGADRESLLRAFNFFRSFAFFSNSFHFFRTFGACFEPEAAPKDAPGGAKLQKNTKKGPYSGGSGNKKP
jgi:hypothetical protein